jgi:hypothetical protein
MTTTSSSRSKALSQGKCTQIRDEPKFRAIAKARNELLHARVAEVPSLKNGVEVHKAAYDIAARYLAAIIEHARVASPPKMISTTGFDESKA